MSDSESDDEDYNPQLDMEGSKSEDSSGSDDSENEDDESQTKKRKGIDFNNTDDVNMNKRQKEELNEDEERKRRISLLWQEMNSGTNKKEELPVPLSAPHDLKEDASKVTKAYEFAGSIYNMDGIKLTTPSSSHTADLNEPTSSDSAPQSIERKQSQKPLRTKSKLTELAQKYGVKTQKLNTLEKSKVDWNRFVADEGIGDDLKKGNKDGYLEKVAFLRRSDERVSEILRNNSKKK